MLSGRFRSWRRICQTEAVVGLWSLVVGLRSSRSAAAGAGRLADDQRPTTKDRFPTVTIKRWQLDRTVARRKTGGKSELRRAVCRITSGKPGSSPVDGKCHRKHTAPAATL